MTPFLLAAAIALVAFTVRGFSGFGSALVMTPLLALVFDPRLAVVSTALLGASIGAGITVQARREIDWPVLRRLLVTALPAIVVGALLLARAQEGSLRRALGIVVMLFGARMLALARAGSGGRRKRWPPRLGYLVGSLSGLLGGAFGTGAPPIVIFLENQLESRIRVRATVLAAILALDITRLASYTATGIVTREMLVASLLMLPAALAGAVLGSHLHLQVSERTFRAALGLFLLAAGALLVPG